MSAIRQYLFAGDAGIAQATQVPSMNQQGDGQVLEVQSDIGAYNCWQKTILDDNVYETYRQEVLPVVNSWDEFIGNGLTVTNVDGWRTPASQYQGKVVFQFELMGMTNMKRIFLDYVWGVAMGKFPTMAATNATATAKRCGVLAVDGSSQYKASDIPQPEYALLDCIKRVQFTLGKEKLIFEDGSVESIKARKVHFSSLNLQPQEAVQTARLGLRYAKNLVNQSQVSDAIDKPIIDTFTFNDYVFNRTTVPENPRVIQGNQGLPNLESLDEYRNYYNSFMEHVTLNTTTRGIAKTIGSANYSWLERQDNTCPCTIPLFCIIPFLAQTDTYLPKGLPIEIRIDFDYYAGYKALLASQQCFSEMVRLNDPVALDNLASQFYVQWQTFGRTLGGIQMHADSIDSPFIMADTQNSIKNTIRIVYDYYILKENLLKEFNLTWLHQPLLYNYYKWRRYDMIDHAAGPTTSISYNLLINQQRPLVVYLRFETIRSEKTNQVTGNNIPITSGGNTYVSTDKMYGVNCLAANTSRRLGGLAYSSPIINYITGSCAGIAMNLIECYVGSQLVYRADVKSNTNSQGYSVHGVMDSLNQSSRDNSSNVVQCAQLRSEMAMYDNACPYKIILTQSKAYERGMYALDRGNTNLRFNIRLDKPLDVTKYTLAMYACYPAQMTIDKSYTAIESQWPVIIAKNGPILQSQYNIN